MKKNMIYILLFFFHKRLELIYEAGEMIKDIVKKKKTSDKQKVDEILLVLEQLGLSDMCYKKAADDNTMRRVEFTPDIVGDFNEGEFLVEFRTELVDSKLMNGVIIFEIILN